SCTIYTKQQKYSNSCYETVDEKCIGSSKIQTEVYATASFRFFIVQRL
ncbi:hypothetical protein Csa_023805, partial [Cucumis sativus]